MKEFWPRRKFLEECIKYIHTRSSCRELTTCYIVVILDRVKVWKCSRKEVDY